MSNLYQDAILDAKALRASAMANAKAALEEAFEPKIQEMISKKLAEEADEEENMEEAMDMKDEAEVEEADMHDKAEMEESAEINEAELEEILNQLEELETQNEATLNEAEEEEQEEEENEEEGEGEEENATEDEEIVDNETKVIDITLGDLKQVLQSVMASPVAEPEGPEAEAEADINLDEILDELSAEGMEEPGHRDPGYEAGHNTPSMEEELKEAVDMATVAAGLAAVPATAAGIAALMNVLKKKNPKLHAMLAGAGQAAGSGIKGGTTSDASIGEIAELEEAKATIETLRKDLQEVNLLNAKYLYMNKLFKSKSLTESEKVKVINALDRATNVKEVKLTYETIKESFEKKKQTIKESISFASKPAGVAPKANIMEADQFINRWQKLAGINK